VLSGVAAAGKFFHTSWKWKSAGVVLENSIILARHFGLDSSNRVQHFCTFPAAVGAGGVVFPTQGGNVKMDVKEKEKCREDATL